MTSAHAGESLTGVALVNGDDGFRVTLALSAPVKYYVSSLHNPERLVVDLLDTRLHTPIASIPLANTPVKKLRSGIRNGNDLRLVFELEQALNPRAELIAGQLAIDLTAKGAANKSSRTAASESQSLKSEQSKSDISKAESAKSRAVKTADAGGQRDVIIAIDAGHGGDDPGAIGAGKLQEKHVTLAIARELAAQINRERGYKAVLTRNNDVFLPLKTRRDLARKAQADLMISIHADSFADRSAEGGSVFALSNRGATSTMAAFLAESENNADAIGGVPVEGKDDDLVKVLADLSLTETMSSSLTIGRDVLRSMDGITRLHSPHVEQAAFVVLKSPDTPSILVETGFISNPKEARRLGSRDYQKQMASAIFKGVDRYFTRNPPPNTYLAAKRRGARDSDTLASNP
ncbi:MAG: N-acetylmuramoyl-L-alanine amidase [Spongiibacteraceae bacterium]